MKIGIIGAGYVGSATAFSLSMCGIADEIVLVNRTLLRAKSEAIDIRDSLPILSNTIINIACDHASCITHAGSPVNLSICSGKKPRFVV